jgi:purine-binding chemotaxis protein CheW
MQIKEIIGMLPITSVPQVPPHVKGVINLRGKVIPVTDLRLRFGIEEAPYTERTCIIVVESISGGQIQLIGVVVDAVSEVLNIKPEEIEPPPAFDGSVTIDFILGLAKCAGGVKILLDIDRVLGDQAPQASAPAAPGESQERLAA